MLKKIIYNKKVIKYITLYMDYLNNTKQIIKISHLNINYIFKLLVKLILGFT